MALLGLGNISLDALLKLIVAADNVRLARRGTGAMVARHPTLTALVASVRVVRILLPSLSSLASVFVLVSV